MAQHIIYDIEIAPNYLLIVFSNGANYQAFGHTTQLPTQDIAAIRSIICAHTLVGFNNQNFDDLLLRMAITGATCQQLHAMAQRIIQDGLKRWEWPLVETPAGWDSMDILEVLPGVGMGLKTYMARIHAPTIQDLPFAPNADIHPTDIPAILHYCQNDVAGTVQLFEMSQPRIKLREEISDKYHVDMRSKSDAQIAEAIIKASLSGKPHRMAYPPDTVFVFTPAPFVQFVSPTLQNTLATLSNARYVWDGREVKLPPEVANLTVSIGTSTYSIGIGGLHSNEQRRALRGNYTDWDVASFYPSLAINLNLLPPAYAGIYTHIFNQRQLAKHTPGMETTNNTLKIVLNGAYGKLWSHYSFLCAPESGLNITLNGQLALLMLIEMLELAGVGVVSANTDGIVVDGDATDVVRWWEAKTKLQMESTNYTAIYSRDVNSYVALTESGKIKRKGRYSDSGLFAQMGGVHPQADISTDAAIAYMLHGAPIEQTIKSCQDIRKFITIRKSTTGATWRGQYLGKTVRWYYSTAGTSIMTCKQPPSKVAASDGAIPVQVLPTTLPTDIDYTRYINIAIDLVRQAGATRP